MGLLAALFNDGVQLTPAYRIFTRRYDRQVRADELQSVLGPLDAKSRAELDEAWNEYSLGVSGWKMRSSFQAMELATQLRDGLTDLERSQTLVSILIDQSGSMRGQKILMTAMATDILQAGLAGIGMRTEVLGFTTVGWHGGRSRKRWKWLGRPKCPGRLCDLLHVIYKDAADLRTSMDGWAFHEMLRPDLPRENVDGEAVDWAVTRMRARPEKQKILIVISDGAPVDDSTLLENGVEYLSDHLRSVIGRTNADGDIRLFALGLAHDVRDFYPAGETIEVPNDIFLALARIVGQLAPSTPDPV